jgi:hypothetical protein
MDMWKDDHKIPETQMCCRAVWKRINDTATFVTHRHWFLDRAVRLFIATSDADISAANAGGDDADTRLIRTRQR